MPIFMVEENIIESIPGEFISQALRAMPNAATSPYEERNAVIMVPGIGRVRVICKKMTHKRAKLTHVFWMAVRVVRIQ